MNAGLDFRPPLRVNLLGTKWLLQSEAVVTFTFTVL